MCVYVCQQVPWILMSWGSINILLLLSLLLLKIKKVKVQGQKANKQKNTGGGGRGSSVVLTGCTITVWKRPPTSIPRKCERICLQSPCAFFKCPVSLRVCQRMLVSVVMNGEGKHTSREVETSSHGQIDCMPKSVGKLCPEITSS